MFTIKNCFQEITIRFNKLLLFSALFISTFSANQMLNANHRIGNCNAKLEYCKEAIKLNCKNGKTALKRKGFEEAINACIATSKKFLENTKNSLSKKPINGKNHEFGKNKGKIFFVEKMILDPKSKKSMYTDIHGDIHNLMKYLSKLESKGWLNNDFGINGNKYIIFLGDYTGRGGYSAEVLYILARLKIRNPKRVILLRGNHEDMHADSWDGFAQELNKKFYHKKLNKDKQKKKKALQKLSFENIQKFYDIMPSAVYIGTKLSSSFIDYCLFCHGGLEFRFNPKKLLASKGKHLFQQIWLDKLDASWLNHCCCVPKKKKHEDPNKRDRRKAKEKKLTKGQAFYNTIKNITKINVKPDLGFLWNCFEYNPNTLWKPSKEKSTKHKKTQESYKYGKTMTREFLYLCSSAGKYKVKYVFRGHQHKDINFWNPDKLKHSSDIKLQGRYPVWTFDKAKSYAILTTSKDCKKWTLRISRV